MVQERFQGANVVDAGKLSPYWGEHVARYRYALPFVENKDVLDIACGTGYGLSFLQRTAKSVIGVDVDMTAARQAVRECNPRQRVVLGDGTKLPFDPSSFDVVVSFETLEHLHARSRFISELRRVLRPSGCLILSTPNAKYTKPVNGRPTNPFHVHEYEPDELQSELIEHFSIDELLGQTLDDRFKIPPFEDAQGRLSKDIGTRARLIMWKLFNKIPRQLRDRLSQVLWKRPFYPTETDYRFTRETVRHAPVLIAICRK